MTLEELLKTVKKVDIFVNSIPHKKLSGSFQSPYKGTGLTTDHIRKYELGDDVRTINWNVTARLREPFVNTFTEDKERLVWIMVDVSSSLLFGINKTKLDTAIEIAATLAHNSAKKNDAVGLILFSDKIELLIKPAKGMATFRRIAKTLVETRPVKKNTGLPAALSFFEKINSRKSLLFIISDFISSGEYVSPCKLLAQKHDVTAIRIFDDVEGNLKGLGWINMRDAESGATRWVNTSAKSGSIHFNDHYQQSQECFDNGFKNTRVKCFAVSTSEDYAQRFHQFMHMR